MARGLFTIKEGVVLPVKSPHSYSQIAVWQERAALELNGSLTDMGIDMGIDVEMKGYVYK